MKVVDIKSKLNGRRFGGIKDIELQRRRARKRVFHQSWIKKSRVYKYCQSSAQSLLAQHHPFGGAFTSRSRCASIAVVRCISANTGIWHEEQLQSPSPASLIGSGHESLERSFDG